MHVRLLLDAVFLLQVPRPELAGRPELRHLLPEVAEDVEVEREAADEGVDVVAPRQHVVDVGVGDEDGAGDLLRGRRARLPDMVAADADRVRPGQDVHGVLDGVADQLHRGLDREDPRAPADHLLEDVVLRGCGDHLRAVAELLRHRLVHGEHDGGDGVDGEARPDLSEVDILEGDLEVPERIDRHPHPAHLAFGHGVVRVVAHLRGEVEGDVQPRLAVGDHQLEPLVRLGGVPKPVYCLVVQALLL